MIWSEVEVFYHQGAILNIYGFNKLMILSRMIWNSLRQPHLNVRKAHAIFFSICTVASKDISASQSITQKQIIRLKNQRIFGIVVTSLGAMAMVGSTYKSKVFWDQTVPSIF